MSDALENVLARLHSVRESGQRQWEAHCPAHDDHRPSLGISVGDDGRVLLYCHAGCTTEDVCHAIELELVDLFDPKNSVSANGRKRIVATYDYLDEKGGLLYQVVRYEPKGFRQRRPDGNGGWRWNLKGVRRVPYRLPELLSAAPDSLVYVSEGEKDADRLHETGLIATTCPGGAGKWGRLGTDPALKGRNVVVLPHNDTAGQSHAQDVATRLAGRAASVRILKLEGLPQSGDVTNWLDSGNDPEDLDRLAAAAPEWSPGPPPTRPVYRSAREARAAVHEMAQRGQGLREGVVLLADQVCEWFERRGDKALEGDIDYPVAWVAAALRISRQRLYQLRDVGRVRLELSTTVDISERCLRPLARLLECQADRIPAAFKAACERAEAESRIRGKRKPVNSRHTAAAVAELLPAAERAPTTVDMIDGVVPDGAERDAAVALGRQIAECLDATGQITCVPKDLWTALKIADQLAQQWLSNARS